MHHHQVHLTLAELRSAQLRQTAEIARRTRRQGGPATTPRVVETSPAPTPVERDPFLDGLDHFARAR